MSEKYVLVVEDDPFYSKIYKTKLSRENINAQLAGNGDEALQAIEKYGTPELILLDLLMPGKDGFETVKDLKEKEETKNIPVIILSNLSQEEDIKKLMDMGVKEYLIKANTPIQTVIDKIRVNLESV
ncbi:MAG: response regulator [Candidatus Moranbacteria bacterium]|nr:response regulator [Candidatus Moranbacteria bacterium]MDD3964573.1 response regulator [Candidatus Moranbacteria bacterium]